MHQFNTNDTPVFPFEYDHLLLYSDADYAAESNKDEKEYEEDLYNHETYKYQ